MRLIRSLQGGGLVVIFGVWVLVLGCLHRPPRLDHPYVTVETKEAIIFVEGGVEPEEVIRVLAGDLVFKPVDWSPEAFEMLGSGRFIVAGRECDYRQSGLSCDGAVVDLSLGGVIFKRDGRVIPVNPLPVMAR